MDIETLEQHRPVKTAIERAANSVNLRINQLKICSLFRSEEGLHTNLDTNKCLHSTSTFLLSQTKRTLTCWFYGVGDDSVCFRINFGI